MDGQHGVEWFDKEDGRWAQKRKKRKIDHIKPKSTAKLVYRLPTGAEYEVATGDLKFQLPIKPIQPSKPVHVPNRKRGYEFLDFEASETEEVSEEVSSEIEIPEDLANEDPQETADVPSLESLPSESAKNSKN